MTVSLRTLLCGGAAFALLPAVAAAQDVRNLDDVPSDVRIYTGEIATTPVVYSYTIPAGTALVIDVIPSAGSELDPILTVTDADTGEVLAEDDDGGEGVGSRARVYSAEGRRVQITVSSFGYLSGEETFGDFELQLREVEQSPATMQRIGFGSSTQGRLGGGEGELFVIEGEEGQLLEVAMLAVSEGLDPLLELYEGEGAWGDPIASDDDGGSGINALLRAVLPASGPYTIRATSFDEASGGEFSLRVAEAGLAELQSPQQSIGLGERLSGRLGEGYESASQDPAEITYRLTPEAIAAIRGGVGEVTVNMTTPLFEDEDFPSNVDSYLELGFETPLGYATVLMDDDGGEGLNARIALDLSDLANEGDWLERLRIRASSIGSGGDFEIELTEGLQEVEQSYEYGVEDEPLSIPLPP